MPQHKFKIHGLHLSIRVLCKQQPTIEGIRTGYKNIRTPLLNQSKLPYIFLWKKSNQSQHSACQRVPIYCLDYQPNPHRNQPLYFENIRKHSLYQMNKFPDRDNVRSLLSTDLNVHKRETQFQQIDILVFQKDSSEATQPNEPP